MQSQEWLQYQNNQLCLLTQFSVTVLINVYWSKGVSVYKLRVVFVRIHESLFQTIH